MQLPERSHAVFSDGSTRSHNAATRAFQVGLQNIIVPWPIESILRHMRSAISELSCYHVVGCKREDVRRESLTTSILANSFFSYSTKKERERKKERKKSRSVVSNSLRPHGLLPTRLFRPWDFPGKNTGVGCRFPLQGIFPIQ